MVGSAGVSAMTEFQPLKPLQFTFDLERRIEQAFSELIHEPWGRGLAATAWQPAVDIHETDDAYLIEADLPGVTPEDMEIRLDGQRLTICGRRQSLAWTQSGRTLRVERAAGEFCRVLELEHPVDGARIDKQCHEGILRVRLPKRRSRPSSNPTST
jgi:HSP20 family protein